MLGATANGSHRATAFVGTPQTIIKRCHHVALETAPCHETLRVHQEKHRPRRRPKRCRRHRSPDWQAWKVLHANFAPFPPLPAKSSLRLEKESTQLTRRKS